ncbi:uncharacterized protein BXZ73DRAFT_101038 [Epithele typhae]|uniref:uncharacterized protein n=1 Tax=Epithele typhae TaxID=378194 RepID=UPI0020080AEF|nr:uncharacterized protein BXZ73DRAFT_101038 [Epithele typhae]KAH9933655.1 hypothetical protein BXZ73DRAFT_101038 [Epithele typhae]
MSPSPSSLTSSGPAPPSPLTVLLLGVVFGILLHGSTLHQAYKYARSFPRDSPFIKMLVFAMVLLETVHTAFTMHLVYFYLVLNYGNVAALATGSVSLNVLPAIAGAIVLTSQLILARRVAMLGRVQRIVVYIAIVLCVAESALAILGTIVAFLFDNRTIVTSVTGIGLVLAAIAELMMSTTMVLAFRHARAGGTRTEHESPIDWWEVYIVNTGVLTCLFNVLTVLLAVSDPHGLGFIALSIVGTRRNVLSVLNGRQIKLAGMEIFVDPSRPVFLAHAQRDAKNELWNVPKAPGPASEGVEVKIVTETEDDGGYTTGRKAGSLA